ncbi:MAG: NAD(P)/FAD-dependent oxidoreductase [Bacteroidetes bacterium]|nr:NAD(P)/FAD-dependent oxidoreductase [Bacteroidota bacterium]
MAEKFEDLKYPVVVIIGGGFAGLELAKKLSRKPFKVYLLDRHNYHTFQPLLYQVATGGLGSDAIAYPLRKVIGPMPNVSFRMAEVQRMDTDNKKVITDVGDFAYDYLVLATGTKTNYFGNSALQNLTMPLKTIPEALDIRSYFLQEFEKALVEQSLSTQEAALNFVIVGAGPTGVELAGAMAEIRKNVMPNDYRELDPSRMHIHLIEAGNRVLATMSEKSSRDAQKFLEDIGVEIMLNTMVTGYDGKELKLKDQESILAETVIWSAGVMGNLPEGLPASFVQRGNRIKVDEFGQVPGLDGVFAIGDIAAMISEKHPNGYPMLGSVAIQQGPWLGENLIRLANNQPLRKFVYKDKGSMATVGRNRAVVDLPFIHLKGIIAWYIWMFVHLMLLVSFRNRVIVFVNWAWNYLSYERAIRLIIRPYKKKDLNGE